MTPKYVLRKSLCRAPHCAGPPDLRYVPFSEWGPEAVTMYRRQAIIEIECLGFTLGYAEPGYDDPAKGILFADWNYFPRGIDTILKKMGYAIEWSDEWCLCDCCGNALRTSPDSYSWKRSYIETADGRYCLNCFTDADLEQYEDDPDRCITFEIDLAKYGYHLLEDGFENGWHPGQTDNPRTIAQRLWNDGHTGLLFKLTEQSQFYAVFAVWERDR